MILSIPDWFQKYNVNTNNLNLKLGHQQSITHFGKYPIHIACLEKNKSLIEYLLKKGINLQVYTYIERRNVLHYCCISNLKIIKFIYSDNLKSLLFIQDYKGMTPLDLVLDYNKIDILLFFIEEGLFLDNELLIKYLFKLESINNLLLTNIQINKYRLITNLIVYRCLTKIKSFLKYTSDIKPLFEQENLYLVNISGIEGLQDLISDFLGFKSQYIWNILNFVNLISLLLLENHWLYQS